MGGSWGIYKTPCPNCSGEVEYWHFDADCRGNDASNGINCKSCKQEFTSAEWDLIARDEMRERDREYWFRELASLVSRIADTVKRNPEIAEELEAKLNSGKVPTNTLFDPAAELHQKLLCYGEYWQRLKEVK